MNFRRRQQRSPHSRAAALSVIVFLAAFLVAYVLGEADVGDWPLDHVVTALFISSGFGLLAFGLALWYAKRQSRTDIS